MNEIKVQKCLICVQSKMHRTNFKSQSAYWSTLPGQLVHLDVCSFEEVSRRGYKYFVTFVDDCSKYVNVYPMNMPIGFKSPNSMLGIKIINVSRLHPFGCLTWFKIPESDQKKLDPKGKQALILSYLPDGNGY
jgi:hypothetical protein